MKGKYKGIKRGLLTASLILLLALTGCENPVSTIPVSGIELDKTSAELAPQDTLQLGAVVYPENASMKNISWTSSDSTVATVTGDGLVTADGLGTAVITATAEDGGVTAEFSLSVKDFFITVWKTDNSSLTPTTIRLPVYSSSKASYPMTEENYDFVADWGDGTKSTISGFDAPEIYHDYETPGTYEVRISGTMNGLSFYGGDSFSENKDHAQKLVEVKRWGDAKWGPSSSQFAYCINLERITAPDLPDLSETTNLENVFGICKKLSVVERINEWDTSNVIIMAQCFEVASKFNQDISGWDTSKVTTMSGMFYNAGFFNQDISGWDFSNVKTMHDFCNSSGFTTELYDKLLISLAGQDVRTGVPLEVSSRFSAAALSAREDLINNHGWQITDGGQL